MSDGRFHRSELMLGPEAMARLASASVAVVGLGAVGSYAVEALARSGVGRLRLVDFDTVALSNINRQLYALESTVGLAKCDVAAARVRDIHPGCVVEPIRERLSEANAAGIVAGHDLVVDAIDSPSAKAALIAASSAAGIAVAISLGAARRRDPCAVRRGLLDEVAGCPLGREVRSRLRKAGFPASVPCIYSLEAPAAAPPRGLVEGDPDGATAEGRPRRVLPSLPAVTGAFGLALASLAIEMLLADSEGDRA